MASPNPDMSLKMLHRIVVESGNEMALEFDNDLLRMSLNWNDQVGGVVVPTAEVRNAFRVRQERSEAGEGPMWDGLDDFNEALSSDSEVFLVVVSGNSFNWTFLLDPDLVRLISIARLRRPR